MTPSTINWPELVRTVALRLNNGREHGSRTLLRRTIAAEGYHIDEATVRRWWRGRVKPSADLAVWLVRKAEACRLTVHTIPGARSADEA